MFFVPIIGTAINFFSVIKINLIGYKNYNLLIIQSFRYRIVKFINIFFSKLRIPMSYNFQYELSCKTNYN